MTPTEATIVLAFRANIGPKAIAEITGEDLDTVESILMRHPHYRTSTEDVFAAVVS